MRKERTEVLVPGRRWDFKFQTFEAGKASRGGLAPARYGVPRDDRKKGMIKIPTSVQ